MGYLDNTGLARVWGKIVTALSGKLDTTGNAYRTASIPFAQVDSTSTATVYTATVPGITELRSGVCVMLMNGVVTSASGFTININSLGAKPVYSTLAAATRATTLFNINYTLFLVFNEERVSGGCWDAYYGYDSNTNTIGYQLRTNSTTMPTLDKFYRYRLLFTSADRHHFVPANTSSSTNATSSRTVNQRPIDPFGAIYYYGHTTAINASENPSTSYMWTQYNINLGYSFNRTGSALTLTNHASVYIKCAPQSDGSAIIDADNPFVQTLPSAADGKIYISLGIASGAETVELVPEHPVYCYRDGQIRLWTGNEESELPDFTAADEGKILGIENGVLAWVEQTGGSGEIIYFDDRNDDVVGYLTASETYTAANRATVSVISQYASASTEDQDAPKPFMGHYNLFPDVDNNVEGFVVRTFGEPPRMLKLENIWNVRDCGGYSADGGKVKYGMLFRGSRLNNATSSDLALLANVGIKLDLDIRDAGNAANGHIPNADYLNVPLTNAYAQMIQNEATAAANTCIAAMNAVVANKPVYVHCASGADRTGCICAMLEAVLGMSDADIDRDFELTCFSDTENLTGHHRNGGSWTAFWAALPTNQGSAKLNVAKFLRDNGVTTALINSFRRAAIDGNPADIDVQTRSITNNLTGCTTSNNATSVVLNDPYSATITPNTGYTLLTLTVTMGGVDITSTAVSGGTITIASVTGNVVITALAEAQTSYTNLVRTSQAVVSTAIYNNGTGYKNGYYLDSGDGHESPNASDCMTGCIPYGDGTITQTDVIYIKGYAGTAAASHTRLCSRNSSKTKISVYTGFLSSNSLFTVESLGTNYYKLTPQTGVFANVNYLQFSFAQPDGSGIIITKNEPIE